VEIERFDSAAGAALAGCDAVWRAANAADNPLGSRMSAPVLAVWLRYGFTGDPAETWFVRAPATGDIAGWYRLELPDLENRHRAALLITVRPASRRQGLGRALLRHAAGRASAAGRVVFGGEVRDGLAGDAFAARAGATPGIGAALRVLDLRKVPDGKIAEIRAAAARAATGYSVVRWTGATPDEYLDGMAAATNAYEDAPHDAGVEPEDFDASRIRDRADATVTRMGLRMYTVAAVHAATGQLAAMTQFAVEPGEPRWGHQALTAVTRTHRGHRLGLLVKTSMLEWIAAAEPLLERVETGNANDNAHMIAVNDTLGFEVVPPVFHTVELDVAKALSQP